MASSAANYLMVWTLDPTQEGVRVDDTRYTAGTLKAEVIKLLGFQPSHCDVFAVWMTSPELSIQLKDHNVPYKMYKKWKKLLTEYTTAEYDTVQADEPTLTLQRNVFLTVEQESMIADERVIHLLYKEAVHNVVQNRYSMTDDELLELAGIQAVCNLQRAEPEECNGQYFRDKLPEYFPQCKLPAKKSSLAKMFSRISVAPPLEDQLADKYRELYPRLAPAPGAHASPPSAAVAEYLRLCRSKPYYGSVFFSGQVAKRVNLFQALLPHLKDRSVLVAINTENVCILEDIEPRELLLQIPLNLLYCDLDEPEEEGDAIFSCLWLQWPSQVPADPQDDSAREDKRLPIYSRQAAMMNAMITSAHQINSPEKRPSHGTQEEVVEPGDCLVCDTMTEEGHWKPAGYFTHTRTLDRRDPWALSKAIAQT